MPYIEPKARKKLDKPVNRIIEQLDSVGELNYVVTRLCMGWVLRKGLCYGNLNHVWGVLGLVKQEIWNRVGFAYERRKRLTNGDVAEFEAAVNLL